MTELDLYKFINDNDIEWHYYGDKKDVLIFPRFYNIEKFVNLLSPGVFDDGGIKCSLKHNYFAIWMRDICEYHGIELENVFLKENEY